MLRSVLKQSNRHFLSFDIFSLLLVKKVMQVGLYTERLLWSYIIPSCGDIIFGALFIDVMIKYQ